MVRRDLYFQWNMSETGCTKERICQYSGAEVTGRIYTAFYGKLDKMKIISTGTVPFPLCVMSLACTLPSIYQSLSILNKIISQNRFILAKFRARLRQCTFLFDRHSILTWAALPDSDTDHAYPQTSRAIKRSWDSQTELRLANGAETHDSGTHATSLFSNPASEIWCLQ
jgi:hypothetical protein